MSKLSGLREFIHLYFTHLSELAGKLVVIFWVGAVIAIFVFDPSDTEVSSRISMAFFLSGAFLALWRFREAFPLFSGVRLLSWSGILGTLVWAGLLFFATYRFLFVGLTEYAGWLSGVVSALYVLLMYGIDRFWKRKSSE